MDKDFFWSLAIFLVVIAAVAIATSCGPRPKYKCAEWKLQEYTWTDYDIYNRPRLHYGTRTVCGKWGLE